jgi:hypothetical protein
VSRFFVIAENRTIAMVEIFKNRGEPFTRVEGAAGGEPMYGNLFIAEIASHTETPLELRFELVGAPGMTLVMPNNPIHADENHFLRQPFTVQFPKGALSSGRGNARILIHVTTTAIGDGVPRTEIQEKAITLVGPF